MKNELYTHLQSGFAEKQRKSDEARVRNPGADWRGGNSGCMTEDGIIIGASPRTTLLRHLGIEMTTTLDDDLIFQAGILNEDHWTELLGLAKIPYKCEEDIPIAWNLPNGESVGGRPDIVVGKVGAPEFTPDYGVELKLISSNGKMARHSHFGEANPMPYMVCQSAHYSWRMGIPWVLAFTNRAHFTSFYFGAAKWQFQHRAMMWSEKDNKPVNVGPFISMYDITWDGDNMLLDDQSTIITASGIQRFYQYVSDCVRNKIIPGHGDNVDIFGRKEKKQSSHVLYDDFAEANSDGNFDDWVEECRDIAMGGE